VRRACVVTLKFATESKRHRINLLLEAYRGCVNAFIRVLWPMATVDSFHLDKKTLELVPSGRLSERYKSNALKQAIEIVLSTKRACTATGNKSARPRFKGDAVLDAKFVSVEDKESNPGDPFDLVVRISCLTPGERITVPTCRTKPLNKWLSRPGAEFVQGCSLSENSLTLWVEEPDQDIPFAPSPDAVVLGGDLGMNKLLTVKDAHRSAYLGREYHELQKRIRRSKPNSKGRERLLTERDHVISRTLNAIPWNDFDVLGIEDLTGITRGKGKVSKEFRRQRLPWAHRRVLERSVAKAEENRVLLVAVHPANTFRECPKIYCRCASALNRKGESFRCVACGHTEDADRVGAGNIRSRTLAVLERRREWLRKNPSKPNRVYLTNRRSLASRRPKKQFAAIKS
jgi:Putative transposase DNA-binding domain